MSKKKKIIVLSCMIALLAVTAVFNYLLTGSDLNGGANETVTAKTYFEQYRSERSSTRSSELNELDSVISVANVDSSEYNDALNMKTSLQSITEKEMYLEALIKAYGFKDCVVTIGLDSDNVNVIVASEQLSNDDAILIYSIIEEENIGNLNNVKIIPIS